MKFLCIEKYVCCSHDRTTPPWWREKVMVYYIIIIIIIMFAVRPMVYLSETHPLAVRGAKPGMKKCSLGKGTILTASLRRSAFSWPGKRRQVVMPDMARETR